MSANTLAELITDVLQGLGFPSKQYCEIEDAARAVVHASALVKQTTGFSSQNLNFKSTVLRPTARDIAVAGVGDIAVPAWIERRLSAVNSTDDSWSHIRVCNLSELESARQTGAARCAFYVEDEQLHVKFSYDPDGEDHRLWYSPQTWIATTLNSSIMGSATTPSQFFPLITGLAQLILIPQMRVRAAMDKENPAGKDLVSAWDKMEQSIALLVGPVPNWADRLKHYAYSARGGSRGRRRRPVLSRGL